MKADSFQSRLLCLDLCFLKPRKNRCLIEQQGWRFQQILEYRCRLSLVFVCSGQPTSHKADTTEATVWSHGSIPSLQAWCMPPNVPILEIQKVCSEGIWLLSFSSLRYQWIQCHGVQKGGKTSSYHFRCIVVVWWEGEKKNALVADCQLGLEGKLLILTPCDSCWYRAKIIHTQARGLSLVRRHLRSIRTKS